MGDNWEEEDDGEVATQAPPTYGRECRVCHQEGHYARECPQGSGGGGSRGCHKCGEEGHMARECPTGGGGGSRACFKCGEEGHMSRECPTGGGGGSRACFKCGEEGHMSRECPTGGASGGSRACHKCGEEGHMSRECPTGGGGGGGSRACHKCGEEGHMARECPTAGGSSGQSGTGCRKCGQEGHFARDCVNEAVAVEGAEKKERYETPAMPEGDAIFTDHHESHTGSGINFSKYDSIPVEVSGEQVPPRVYTFQELELRPLILENLTKCGYKKPTPIQGTASPVLMAGRDVMACAQTGSGKTAGFLLPIINTLMKMDEIGTSGQVPCSPEALIVAPTRELAVQIGKEANTYGHGSIVRSRVVYGGTTLFSQRNILSAGVNVLVATPGRLIQLLNESLISLSKIKFFILDEADRMLDMGFMPDIEKIIAKLPPKEQRTSGMFSATFPPDIQRTAQSLLNNYVFVTVGMVGGACADVQQDFRQVQRGEKRDKVLEILKNEVTKEDKVLIFCGSKKGADFLAVTLSNKPEFSATSIHGDRLQSQREQALREFTTGRRSILVATAVAARGLDIPKVSVVINYDMPTEIDEYVHRIGRTGRVGNTGRAISFFDSEKDADMAPKLVGILSNAGQTAPDWLEAYGTAGLSDGMSGMTMENGGGGDEEEDW